MKRGRYSLTNWFVKDLRFLNIYSITNKPNYQYEIERKPVAFEFQWGKQNTTDLEKSRIRTTQPSNSLTGIFETIAFRMDIHADTLSSPFCSAIDMILLINLSRFVHSSFSEREMPWFSNIDSTGSTEQLFNPNESIK